MAITRPILKIHSPDFACQYLQNDDDDDNDIDDYNSNDEKDDENLKWS